MEARPTQLQVYETADGIAPFNQWLLRLRDGMARTRIRIRLKRLGDGNFGDSKSVGSGVSELRMNFGPGYRIYFAEDGLNVVLLLIGGDKSSQVEDIRIAKEFWQSYKERS